MYWAYFLAGGGRCWLFFETAVFITGQLAASGTDYWITYWTNEETLRVSVQLNESGNGDMKYCNNTVCYRQGKNFTESQWFDEYGLMRPNLGVYVYTICVICCIFFVVLRSLLFVRLCVCASRKIHESMFTNLLQATMRFFNTNPSGIYV